MFPGRGPGATYELSYGRSASLYAGRSESVRSRHTSRETPGVTPDYFPDTLQPFFSLEFP